MAIILGMSELPAMPLVVTRHRSVIRRLEGPWWLLRNGRCSHQSRRCSSNGIRSWHMRGSRYHNVAARVFVANMVMVARKDETFLATSFSGLWLFAYAFLLRLPSEALPACKGRPDDAWAVDEQTLIWKDAEQVRFNCHSRCCC